MRTWIEDKIHFLSTDAPGLSDPDFDLLEDHQNKPHTMT